MQKLTATIWTIADGEIHIATIFLGAFLLHTIDESVD